MADVKVVGTPTTVVDDDVYNEADDADEVDTKPELQETKEVADTDATVTKEKVDEAGFMEVDFLKEKKKLTKEEAIAYAQKGMNYDHVKEKADRAEKAEAELAELRIKLSERELEKSKATLEKQLIKDGYDAEAAEKLSATAYKEAQQLLEKTKEEAQKLVIRAKRATEKEALRKEPYFAEFEADIDKLAELPMYANVTTDTIYELLLAKALRSGKLDEWKSNIKKSTIADYTDMTKRSGTIKADSVSADLIEPDKMLDSEALEMSRLWKTDPKKIAKYVADQRKKKG